MLLFHAPVFLGVGLVAQIRRAPFLPVVALLLASGLTLFCGDLFSRSFVSEKLFSMAAPIGGSLIILGWFALALNAFLLFPKKPAV